MFHPQGPTFLELARQALSSTRRGYDLLAPKFDYTPFRTPERLLQAIAPQIGAPGSVGSALDVCCGTGAAMRMLRPLCRERVVGLDFSPGMLEVCRQRLADAPGEAPLLFLRADARAIPFDAAFDVAVCFGALGHFPGPDAERLVAEVARALRPAGRFLFLTCERPPPWSPRLWLSRAFNAAMHVRNALISPPFVMYYLRFLLPEARALLRAHGLRCELREGLFDGPFADHLLVVATRD